MNEPRLQNKHRLFIGGQWRNTSDGESFITKCPVNGEKLAECTQAAKEDMDDTVRGAWEVFETWEKAPTSECAIILNKIVDIIDANTEHLAMVESLDSGKPIREIIAIDIPLSIRHFRYSAGCITTEEGSVNTLDEQFLSLILHEPVGVTGQIVLWDFPFLMAAWKLVPVPIVGCCSVFKSSSDTFPSVLELARLIQDVIPKDVFSVITGSESKSGQCMSDHKGFRKLVFIGSTGIGYQVVLTTVGRLIPATLELGGKSANTFFPDCNWGQAIDGLRSDILFNQGQVCCTGSRVLVHEDIYDRFLEDAVKASNSIKVGVSWNPETRMGSQISERQSEEILSYVETGRQGGARLTRGGERLMKDELAKGCFIRPTLLTGATNDTRVIQEEVFGPVACILKPKDKDEVIHMANDNVYGLGGTVWTCDLDRVIRISRSTEARRMWVNTYNQIPEGSLFDDYKESGIDYETRKVILECHTQMKNIVINLPEAPGGFYPVK